MSSPPTEQLTAHFTDIRSRVPRLRVFYITRKWPPAVGGMETYSQEITDVLAHEVDLVVRALPGREDGRPPTILRYAYFCILAAWDLLRLGARFDVVHIGDVAIWPLAAVAKLTNRNAVLAGTAHGTDVAYQLGPSLLSRIYGRYLRIASALVPQIRVIANSTATAELCRKIGFRDVTVVNLGVRMTRHPTPDTCDRYVLFVGRLITRKGCAWFVREVLPRLASDIRLKVAGTVWDTSEGAILSNHRVDFLGPVFGESLAELRRRAIAVVMPNIPGSGPKAFEGFGLTALEATADGGVLCAARLDGIVDAVRDRETGFLLPPGDAAAWAERITEIADWSAAQRYRFVERAGAIIATDFNWERVGLATLAIYRRGLYDTAEYNCAEGADR